MAEVETNPYAQPRTSDPVPGAEEHQIARAPLRLAGAILAFHACMKVFGLSTMVSTLLKRFGSWTGIAAATPASIGLLTSTVGFAVPLLLALALLFGRARYRTIAWLYVDIVAVLGVLSTVAAQSFGPAILPKSYLVAVCTERVFFAVAISLLLVGRPKRPRVAAATFFGVLYVANVFGMGWFL